MATLHKHGNIIGDYTRMVWQPGYGYAIGYIFRLMSDGWLLVRPHKPGGKWRVFSRPSKGQFRDLANISQTPDCFLRKQLDDCFN